MEMAGGLGNGLLLVDLTISVKSLSRPMPQSSFVSRCIFFWTRPPPCISSATMVLAKLALSTTSVAKSIMPRSKDHHTFSAFWLWSSVVSVLISVTTDILPTGRLLVTPIFLWGGCSLSLLEGTSRVALALHFARCGTPLGVIDSSLFLLQTLHASCKTPVVGIWYGEKHTNFHKKHVFGIGKTHKFQ